MKEQKKVASGLRKKCDIKGKLPESKKLECANEKIKQSCESDEIESLFGMAKEVKKANKIKCNAELEEMKKAKKQEKVKSLLDDENIMFSAKKSVDRKFGIVCKVDNPEAPLERIDAETGYPVYKAHILKVGEGGGTPLCPFDCDCCY